MDENRKRKKRRRLLWAAVGLAAVGVIGGCGICLVGVMVSPEATNAPLVKPTTDRTSVPPVEKPTAVTEWEGVRIGMPADDVLAIHPKGEMVAESEVIGQDEEGMIVRWSYPGADLVMARWEEDGVYCYRVREIWLR